MAATAKEREMGIQIKSTDEIESAVPAMDGLKDVKMKMLVGETDGARNFYMREFQVSSGGYTPRHSHDYEHEIYILEGRGEVECDGETRNIKANDVFLVPANSLHQFRNTSSSDLRFICLVPA